MTALIRLNEAICPCCLKLLCRIKKSGHAELWCKSCRTPVLLELDDKHRL